MNQKFTLTLPYHPSYSIDKIKSKINEILSKIPIKNIILGCDANTTYAKDVIDYFHEHHIRVYLRLPILCGNTKDRIPMIDMEQKQTARACPSSLHNAHEIIHLYETSFANLPFDGVFFGRIAKRIFCILICTRIWMFLRFLRKTNVFTRSALYKRFNSAS